MKFNKKHLLSVISLPVIFFFVYINQSEQGDLAPTGAEQYINKSCKPISREDVWVPGGEFSIGENKGYANERPAHDVHVDGFWIDSHEVTNQQFSEFVEETGYITVAERTPDPSILGNAPADMLKPGSAVFTPPSSSDSNEDWWSYLPGSYWRKPLGPKSNIIGKENYPVVHIAFEDAQAYAKWADRLLPTEAQFEVAARSKLVNQRYAWGGDELTKNGKHLANTWQGMFPYVNQKEDGFAGIAPVSCFPANDYGAYDLIGNVWEWTSNYYTNQHNPSDNMNPKGLSQAMYNEQYQHEFPMRVIKGGSYLCSPDYCMRYRPAARHAQDTGLGSNHIGFRTVRRVL
jgi:formylglycine-generating enzyme required for sulfatase activity